MDRTTQHLGFNASNISVEDLDAFSYFEDVEHIADSESQPTPPLLRTEIYSCAGTPIIEYTGEPCERNAQCCLETNLQNNP